MAKKRKKRRLGIYLLVAAAAIAIELLVLYLIDKPYSKVVINAGQQMIDAPTFFKKSGNASFVKNNVDTKQPGEYLVKVKKGIFTYSSKVVVTDEVAPLVDYYSEMNVATGDSLEPSALIKSIQEDSYYTVEWVHSIDTGAVGVTTAEVVVRDAAGNETKFSTQLHIVDANIVSTVVIEVGEKPSEKLFFKDGNANGDKYSLTPALNTVDYSSLGDKLFTLEYKGNSCQVAVRVVDTVAPVATVIEKKVKKDSMPKAEVFVKDIVDGTEVSVDYVETPDFSLLGSLTVKLVLKDAAGNTTYYDAVANVMVDTTGPVISGDFNREYYMGEDLSLLTGITAQDEFDGEVVVYVNKDKVKTDTLGDYEITYWAEDSSGNRSEKTGTVRVYSSRSEADKLNTKVNAVLKQIIVDGMSLEAKGKAIYDWVYDNCKFVSHANVYTYDKDKNYTNWRKEAIYGFTKGSGDCFTYYSMSRALLEAVGIPTYEVNRIMPNAQNSRHYWLLVNVGTGWYQFDNCHRAKWFGEKDRGGYLFTKAEAEEYNKLKADWFLFDESLYPGIEIK